MAVELIEAKLLGMNDDAFHRLGDQYLFYEYGVEYDAINPIGQTEGKQKSRGGTPDTTFKLKNGKFALVQYTTQEGTKNRSAFLKKLKDDLLACFDEKKSEIALDDIDHIVLCCNSNPTAKQEEQLRELCKSYELRVINLSTIAQNIQNRYAFLAKEYLGLELDTYQVLPIQKFVSEYERGGFATPLSNAFYFRADQLSEIHSSLKHQLITVVTGKPGVGKSRLVVEALNNILKSGDETVVYCLRNKNLPVLHDLRRYLVPGKSYIIYVDDANQNLNQLRDLLTFYQESEIDIKVVVTVREYVFNELKNFISFFGYNKIIIPGFERDELKKIITSPPFGIKHPAFIHRILGVAHGNARLAVIIATVAKDRYLHELDNLTHIYDAYFQRISVEKGHFFEGLRLKVLGFISFFKIVRTKDTENFDSDLAKFGLSINDFWDTVSELEESEFVDVFTDRSLVKISDQILEGYAFYKCFFVEKALDYQIILDNYFPEHRKRISDTIIETNNTFGFETLSNYVRPYISIRYHAPWTDENDKSNFLRIFWMYMQEEGLIYANTCIGNLDDYPVEMLDELTGRDSEKRIVFQPELIFKKDEKDSLFSLLSQYLLHHTDCFEPAVLLMFQFLKKKPHLAEKLVQHIKGNFTFNYLEAHYDFVREKNFSKLLIEEAEASEGIMSYVYLRLCPHFLKASFRTTISLGNALSFHTNELKGTESIQDLRKLHWDKLESYFLVFPIIARQSLKKIIDGFWLDYNPDIRKQDIPFIGYLMLKYFNMNHIQDIVLANTFIEKLKKKKYTDGNIEKLRALSQNELYKWYQALDWNLYRNKERYDIEESNPEFRKKFPALKEKELLATFDFSTEAEFLGFLKFVKQCLQVAQWNFPDLDRSCKIIFKLFVRNNKADFLSFLKILVFEEDLLRLIWPENLVCLLVENYPEHISDLEDLFNNVSNLVTRQKLLISFYSEIPVSEVNELRCRSYAKIYAKLADWHYLEFKQSANYEAYQNGFIINSLKIVYNRATNGKCRFNIDREFIISHHQELSVDPAFLRNLYIHLDQQSSHFDYDGETMTFLMDRDDQFFRAYIISIFNDRKFKREDHHQLRHIWKRADYVEQLNVVFDVAHSQRYLSWEMENLLKELFGRGEWYAEFEKKRTDFLENYVIRYYNEIKRIEVCFKIINANLHQQKDEFTILFLQHNKDLEAFKKINWTYDGLMVHSGNFNAGIRDEYVYKHLIGIITPLKPKLAYLGHLSYLNQQIDYSRRSAMVEHRWDFESSE